MEELLVEFINTLDLSLRKAQAEMGDRTGISKLTLHQFQYIDAIYALGTPTNTEIAERLKLTKASVTAGIQKLSDLGYVIKIQSQEDKREIHVSLTEASRPLIKAKYQVLKEYGDFINAALTETEARQFKATLTKLVKLFKQS